VGDAEAFELGVADQPRAAATPARGVERMDHLAAVAAQGSCHVVSADSVTAPACHEGK
jgi:hypothetical protein